MKLFPIAFVIPLCACTTSHGHNRELIVTGTLEDTQYIETIDDFGLNSVFAASLRIEDIFHGESQESVLRVRYIAHMERHSLEKARLRLATDGIYEVCATKGGRGYTCD